jgi:hypothetical protein
MKERGGEIFRRGRFGHDRIGQPDTKRPFQAQQQLHPLEAADTQVAVERVVARRPASGRSGQLDDELAEDVEHLAFHVSVGGLHAQLLLDSVNASAAAADLEAVVATRMKSISACGTPETLDHILHGCVTVDIGWPAGTSVPPNHGCAALNCGLFTSVDHHFIYGCDRYPLLLIDAYEDKRTCHE